MPIEELRCKRNDLSVCSWTRTCLTGRFRKSLWRIDIFLFNCLIRYSDTKRKELWITNIEFVNSIITNKCTFFCISVTLLRYICFGYGPAIIRGTLVGSLHWHWFIWYYHTSSPCFCSFCSLSNAGCVRLASRDRDITLRVAVIKQYLVGSS
jgi:hypothetical protein